MNFFQIFIVIASLVGLAGLVTSNPVPLPTPLVAAYATSTFNFDSASSGEVTKIASEEADNSNCSKATYANPGHCCILDSTHTSSGEHAKPSCDTNGCGPVPPPIGFGLAGLGTQECVNVLDNNGKPSIYDQSYISYCSGDINSLELDINSLELDINSLELDINSFKLKANSLKLNINSLKLYIDSIKLHMDSIKLHMDSLKLRMDSLKLYSEINCGGSSWQQMNTTGCYYNSSGIDSIKIIAAPRHKREYLGGGLMNESDALSTSAYPLQGNDASVVPADDCFDEITGAYIMDCEVEHTIVPAVITPPVCLGGPEIVVPSGCAIKKADVDRSLAELVCYYEAKKEWIVECLIPHSDEAGDPHGKCWSDEKKAWLPECLIGRSELPPDQCIDSNGKFIIGCNYAERDDKSPRDKDAAEPPSLAVLANSPSLTTSSSLIVRTSWPTNCKDPDWCININFGDSMCSPNNGPVLYNVTEEGNYQCRNLPIPHWDRQVQVTYLEGQLEGHDPLYAELTVFDGPDCTGNNQTMNAMPICTDTGLIIQSYRVWIEGACGDDIGPCPGVNGGKRAIDHGGPGPAKGAWSTISIAELPSDIIVARTEVTTKKTAAPTAVGETATVSF